MGRGNNAGGLDQYVGGQGPNVAGYGFSDQATHPLKKVAYREMYSWSHFFPVSTNNTLSPVLISLRPNSLEASVIFAEIDAMGAGASSRCDSDPEVKNDVT